MGDRANIVIVSEQLPDHPIFFYTHWDGYTLPETLASALDRGRGRWGDGSYLARIIFNELTKGEELAETGFGISAYLTDNSGNVLVVEPYAQWVGFLSEAVAQALPLNPKAGEVLDNTPKVPFDEYVDKMAKADRAAWCGRAS